MLIHPDRLFSADPSTRKIARRLYDSVRVLPLVSPHGHTQAAWFAANEPFPDPVQLFVQLDHYVFRMLYSQGGGIGGQRVVCFLRGSRAAADSQLCKSVWHRSRRLPSGVGLSRFAGAGA